MRYGSVCSGIEAATAAWEQLGWEAAFFSEIEAFPCAVLKHHYPNVVNYGDMTKYKEWPDNETIDVLVGGTPCQSFSVAGLRKGLDDPRGKLMLTYLTIAEKYRPKWIVWENAPGVLSSNGGRDFGTLLGALGQIGYGFAYRVLDAQYFGVAQRRRRVFVIGYLGDWRPAAAVLFDSESLCGNAPPSREKREETPGFVESSFGQFRSSTVAGTVRGSGGFIGGGSETLIIEPLAFNWQSGGDCRGLDLKETAQLQRCQTPAVLVSKRVRKMTPVEHERLQGFPDGYTDIKLKGKPTPDTPRYKALGNSMAVPVMAWIGQRIQTVNEILSKPGA